MAKPEVPMDWSAIDVAYAQLEQSLNKYREVLRESLPKNPSHFTQMCELDSAIGHVARARVQSKPSNRKRKKSG